MRSTTLKKAVTIALCLAFLMLIVPGAVNAGKKVSRTDVRAQLSKQLSIMQTLLPFLAGIVNMGLPGLVIKTDAQKTTTSSNLSARPTGDLPVGKPSEGD
jgi:hypothetical protein